MSKLTTPMRVLSAVVLVGAGIAVALGAREMTISGGDIRGFVLPATQIISFDDTVGMLETATGAIYELHGDLNNSSGKKSWNMRVPPVKGSTSGLLEIQRATFNHPEAIFLVDIVTGSTWVLETRGGYGRSWEPVDVYRSSQYN